MKLTYPRHQAAFKQEHPLYLISSDDLLLKLETTEEIKSHLKKQGFSEFTRLDPTQDSSGKQLLSQTQNLSLFSTKQAFIMECLLFTEGIRDTLQLYLKTNPVDCALIVSIPKLEKRQMESKWYQILEAKSCHITIWPPEPQAMPAWVRERSIRLGLTLETDAIAYLCERSEHNTLATAQELEKLKLSFQNQTITLADLHNTITQSSRYQVYELSDAVLTGDLPTTRQILSCLKAQKTESFSILMTLTYSLKQVLKLQELGKTMSVSQAFQQCGIWAKKAPIYEAALNRLSVTQTLKLLLQASACERVLKGLEPNDDKDAYLERWVERCCLPKILKATAH